MIDDIIHRTLSIGNMTPGVFFTYKDGTCMVNEIDGRAARMARIDERVTYVLSAVLKKPVHPVETWMGFLPKKRSKGHAMASSICYAIVWGDHPREYAPPNASQPKWILSQSRLPWRNTRDLIYDASYNGAMWYAHL